MSLFDLFRSKSLGAGISNSTPDSGSITTATNSPVDSPLTLKRSLSRRSSLNPDVSEEVLLSLSHTALPPGSPQIGARRAAVIYAKEMDKEEEVTEQEVVNPSNNNVPSSSDSPVTDNLMMQYPNRHHPDLIYSTMPIGEPGMEQPLFN